MVYKKIGATSNYSLDLYISDFIVEVSKRFKNLHIIQKKFDKLQSLLNTLV